MLWQPVWAVERLEYSCLTQDSFNIRDSVLISLRLNLPLNLQMAVEEEGSECVMNGGLGLQVRRTVIQKPAQDVLQKPSIVVRSEKPVGARFKNVGTAK